MQSNEAVVNSQTVLSSDLNKNRPLPSSLTDVSDPSTSTTCVTASRFTNVPAPDLLLVLEQTRDAVRVKAVGLAARPIVHVSPGAVRVSLSADPSQQLQFALFARVANTGACSHAHRAPNAVEFTLLKSERKTWADFEVLFLSQNSSILLFSTDNLSSAAVNSCARV